jgi:putative hemolysin
MMKILDWLTHQEGLSFAPHTRRDAEVARSETGYTLSFATSASEIEEAQRLRFKVFAEEMGARLPDPDSGLDRDVYDGFCEHLLVREEKYGKVVGAYRLLPPEAARNVGRFYSESEFDIARLDILRESTVEAGRSCVHWEHRNGTVIMLLWSGITRFMKRYGYEHLIGCASVSLRDGGHSAANLYKSLEEKQFTAPEYRVFPKLPLPVEKLANSDDVVAPPLVKGYLRIGAKVGGAPAWDPDFNTADLFMLLSMKNMNPRYARHFG